MELLRAIKIYEVYILIFKKMDIYKTIMKNNIRKYVSFIRKDYK